MQFMQFGRYAFWRNEVASYRTPPESELGFRISGRLLLLLLLELLVALLLLLLRVLRLLRLLLLVLLLRLRLLLLMPHPLGCHPDLVCLGHNRFQLRGVP